jgi:hypothetical protein
MDSFRISGVCMNDHNVNYRESWSLCSSIWICWLKTNWISHLILILLRRTLKLVILALWLLQSSEYLTFYFVKKKANLMRFTLLFSLLTLWIFITSISSPFPFILCLEVVQTKGRLHVEPEQAVVKGGEALWIR